MKTLKLYGILIKHTFTIFLEKKGFTFAAALAYYTIFSLPSLLVAITYTTTRFLDPADVQKVIRNQAQEMIGADGAETILSAMNSLNLFGENIWLAMMNIGFLIFTSTTVFVTLQEVLNDIYNVKIEPSGMGILKMIRNRLLSFTLIIGLGFILLLSLSINGLAIGFADYLNNQIGTIGSFITVSLSILLPIIITFFLFTILFRVLPDVKLKWKDVWIGAGLTTLFFEIGKYGIGYYVGNSAALGLYGSASSLLAILLWVFYGSQIFLIGASFIQARLQVKQIKTKPVGYAVKDTSARVEIRG